MFYRPDGKSVCADVIPFFEDGEFKLFYLKDYRDIPNYGEGCDWHLLTTKDLVHYEEHGTVIPRGSVDEQDLYVYTGCCIRHEDRYIIYYTGHNPHKRQAGLPEQIIMRSTSKDMKHWEKDPDFIFAAPDWLEMHDFRDPFVFYDEDKKCYAMLLAGRVKEDVPCNSKGVTLVAYSDDLDHWEVSKEYFFAPEAYYTHECPDLFKMGDWWYLVFSEFTDRFSTTYRMSRSPYGPWITPKINTFDGHAFYAAKSASDGNRRIMFGWNPIKDQEQDNNCWQWGGNIIAHELVQQADGTLLVKCPDEVRDNYDKDCELAEGIKVGSVSRTEAGWLVGNDYGRSIQMLGKVPGYCRIEMTFIPKNEVGDFGIVLNADFGANTFYTVRFEPSFRRLAFDRWPRKDLFQHTSVDVERNCALRIGEENKLTILIQDSVLEVYVNDEVAMGARMFDLHGDFGIYSTSTVVEYKDITVSEEKSV